MDRTFQLSNSGLRHPLQESNHRPAHSSTAQYSTLAAQQHPSSSGPGHTYGPGKQHVSEQSRPQMSHLNCASEPSAQLYQKSMPPNSHSNHTKPYDGQHQAPRMSGPQFAQPPASTSQPFRRPGSNPPLSPRGNYIPMVGRHRDHTQNHVYQQIQPLQPATATAPRPMQNQSNQPVQKQAVRTGQYQSTSCGSPTLRAQLPEGWTTHVDPESRQHYYVHLATMLKQVEFPESPNPLKLKERMPTYSTSLSLPPQQSDAQLGSPRQPGVQNASQPVDMHAVNQPCAGHGLSIFPRPSDPAECDTEYGNVGNLLG